MTLPTVTELAVALAPIKAQAVRVRAAATQATKPEDWHILVRVQVPDEGRWSLHVGAIQYEDCHEGYMGTEFVDPKSDLKVVAASILEEITDHMEIHNESKESA